MGCDSDGRRWRLQRRRKALPLHRGRHGGRPGQPFARNPPLRSIHAVVSADKSAAETADIIGCIRSTWQAMHAPAGTRSPNRRSSIARARRALGLLRSAALHWRRTPTPPLFLNGSKLRLDAAATSPCLPRTARLCCPRPVSGPPPVAILLKAATHVLGHPSRAGRQLELTIRGAIRCCAKSGTFSHVSLSRWPF